MCIQFNIYIFVNLLTATCTTPWLSLLFLLLVALTIQMFLPSKLANRTVAEELFVGDRSSLTVVPRLGQAHLDPTITLQHWTYLQLEVSNQALFNTNKINFSKQANNHRSLLDCTGVCLSSVYHFTLYFLLFYSTWLLILTTIHAT